MADITPPVALAAYAGAGLAGANAMKTGWTAVQIGLAAFIVPFMFAYSSCLVLIGGVGEIVLASITATVGVISLAAAIQGWLLTRAALWERLISLASALLLIKPGLVTDLIGLAGLTAVLLHQLAVLHIFRKVAGGAKDEKCFLATGKGSVCIVAAGSCARRVCAETDRRRQ